MKGKKGILIGVLCAALLAFSGCGGGSGGGGGGDLSCAPSSLDDPAYDNLSGQWTMDVYLTGDCDIQVHNVNCTLTFTQSGNTITITNGDCTADGQPITLDSLQALISGRYFYWGGTLSFASPDYSETDVVQCSSVEFISDSESANISGVTINVTWTSDGMSGTCTSTIYQGTFTRNI